MPAYLKRDLQDFTQLSLTSVVGVLNQAYASDGFLSQYTAQIKSWEESIPILQEILIKLVKAHPIARNWQVLLEYPLYRLRRRIDAVILTHNLIVVIELKAGEQEFNSVDNRQVEEYALDLRDFHEPSRGKAIQPILWCTGMGAQGSQLGPIGPGVNAVSNAGRDDLEAILLNIVDTEIDAPALNKDAWDSGAYQPVPSVVEAATTLFAGHGVEEITRADATNLEQSAKRIIDIIEEAKSRHQRALIFLTGVPGSGKTLAGLQVVHRAIEDGVEDRGDIVYLSGNTPLVTVLREALARDDYKRKKLEGNTARISDVRNAVRTRIQHIIDFLREYLSEEETSAPHEHAIVFDEAQRAWDEAYGRKKFGRSASEPQLLLEIMSRHEDWCALVGLIGGGQEINSGENGLKEWGTALRSLAPELSRQWTIYGPQHVIQGNQTTANLGIGDLPIGVSVIHDDQLQLEVPLRSFRSPLVADWVATVINGDTDTALQLFGQINNFPIFLTRSLTDAKRWLVRSGRGERRYGLVASSGARRLRAEGLGVTLNATDGIHIAQWYLNDHEDVRSSFALEVTANEYTTQGLELDYVCVCWGGDYNWENNEWSYKQFRGDRWTNASGDKQRFIANSYRVLLTRAREGLILWIPEGSMTDSTRNPEVFDRTADHLRSCGVQDLGST